MTSTLTCPRCGYDLSGQAEATRAAAEGRLEGPGTCSECGLTFAWADVLDSRRMSVPGFIEHSSLRLTPFAAWTTWAWTAWPAFFWRKVRLEYPPRVGRIFLWLLLIFGLTFAAAGIPGIALTWPRNLSDWHTSPDRLLDMLGSPWTERMWGNPPDGYYGPVMRLLSRCPAFVPAGIALSVGFPLVLACVPTTRARLKITPGHLLRASVYQLAWLGAVVLAECVKIACCNVASFTLRLIPSAAGGLSLSPGAGLGTTCRNVATSIERTAHHQWALWLILVTAWWCTWWWFALGRGLRIERPGRVWIAGAIPSVLAAMIVVALHPEFLRAIH